MKGFDGLRIWKEGFDWFVERASLVEVGRGVVRDEIVAIFSLWNGRKGNERVLEQRWIAYPENFSLYHPALLMDWVWWYTLIFEILIMLGTNF